MQDEMNEGMQQDESNPEQEVNVEPGESQESNEPEDDISRLKSNLGMERKRHAKQMRDMEERFEQRFSNLESQSPRNNQMEQMSQEEGIDPGIQQYIAHGVQHGVNQVLRAKDEEEKRRKEAELSRGTHAHYAKFQDALENAANKYSDFEEVLNNPDLRITPAMKHQASLVDNGVDVIYKLAKNPSELNRIADLHPIKQEKEINKLSNALMATPKAAQKDTKPMGNLKSTPGKTSSQVTDKTSVSELRQRLKNNWR
jgi:hypothetical protein